MSRFLVNNFCAYCSNLEWNPFLCTFQYCHSFMYLDKWKVTGIVTSRIMARNDLPGINSRWVKSCHDIPITSWGAVVTIEDNYVFCKMKKLSLLNWYRINYICSYRKESSFDFRCFFMKKLHCIQISNRNTHYKPNAMTIYKSIEFTDQNKNMCLSNLCYIVTSTTKWFIILKHGIFGKPLFLYCSHAQWSIYLCVLCLRLINFGKDAQILIVPHASIWTQKITIMAYIFSSLNRAYDRMWRYRST